MRYIESPLASFIETHTAWMTDGQFFAFGVLATYAIYAVGHVTIARLVRRHRGKDTP